MVKEWNKKFKYFKINNDKRDVRVLIDCPDSKGLVYKISKVFYV